MSSGEGQAPAGWYNDPHQPERLRYFDGETWTDHFHAPGRLPGIGPWLSYTFGILRDHGAAALAMAIVISLGATVIWLFGVGLAVGRLLIVNGDLVGFDVTTALLIVGATLLALLWQMAGWLALNRFMQRAQSHHQPSIAEAVRHAITRLPALIGVTLILAAIALLAAVVLVVLFVAAPGLGILASLAFLVGGVWAFVKLAFINQALAAAPARTNWIAESARISRGRFWGVLGRLLLLTILVSVGSTIISSAVGGFGSPVDQDAFTRLIEMNGDEFVVNNFVFSDLFPGGGDLALYLIFNTVLSAIGTVITTSGVMRLYLDAGGQSDLVPQAHIEA